MVNAYQLHVQVPQANLHITDIVIIFRLREVGMPADYVNKLARMFQDIKVSEDLNQQFKEQCKNIKGNIAGKYLQIGEFKLFIFHFPLIRLNFRYN